MNPTFSSPEAYNRFTAMSEAERALAAQAITDEQYRSFFDGLNQSNEQTSQFLQDPSTWKPTSDEDWIAIWSRNSRMTGFESAQRFGSLPLYIFTLPTKPIELLFYAAAKRWPSDSWEGIGYALVPVLIVGSGFLWFKMFQWIKGS